MSATEIWERFNYDKHISEDEYTFNFADMDSIEKKYAVLDTLIPFEDGERENQDGEWDEEGYTYIRNGETITIRRRS